MFKTLIAVLVSTGISGLPTLSFADATPDELHQMIYKTCRELHGNLKQQEALLGPLVIAAAEIYKVDLNVPANVQNIAWLIRTGCSVWPDAYASAITGKAVRSLGDNRNPSPTKAFPHADVSMTDCDQYEQKSPAEQKVVIDMISGFVSAHYKTPYPPYWNDEYLKNSVHNACQLFPGTYVFEVLGQLLRTAGEKN